MLDDLFPEDVVTAWGDPESPSKDLFPEEEAIVARAVPKRRQEFAKGRECARAALETLGFHGFVLLSGESREPLWPSDVVGSITHTVGLCAVAVARSAQYAGIGLDAERAEPLAPHLAKRVCFEDEVALPNGPPSFDAALLPRLVFSAKEAVYKCLFPMTRSYLGFADVRLTFDRDAFRARLCNESPWFRECGPISGRWRQIAGYFVTAVWLERDRSAASSRS